MRSNTFLAFLAFVAFLAQPAYAGPHPFAPGEACTYSLKFLGVKAAEFQMSLKEHAPVKGRQAWLAEGTLRTTAPFSWTYHVQDKAACVMAVDGLKPLVFELNIEEGKYRKLEQVDFGTKKLAPQTYDFLSLLYALRAAPLAVGRLVNVKIWSQKKVMDMPLKVTRLETVKCGVGKRECFILEPVNAPNIKGHAVQVEVAITNDADRYLARFSAKASIATISGTLTKAAK